MINAREDMEKKESSCIVNGNVNWHSRFGKGMEFPLKSKNRVAI